MWLLLAYMQCSAVIDPVYGILVLAQQDYCLKPTFLSDTIYTLNLLNIWNTGPMFVV